MCYLCAFMMRSYLDKLDFFAFVVCVCSLNFLQLVPHLKGPVCKHFKEAWYLRPAYIQDVQDGS